MKGIGVVVVVVSGVTVVVVVVVVGESVPGSQGHTVVPVSQGRHGSQGPTGSSGLLGGSYVGVFSYIDKGTQVCQCSKKAVPGAQFLETAGTPSVVHSQYNSDR